MSPVDLFVHQAPLAVIALALLVAMVLAREVGATAHRWLLKSADAPDRSSNEEGHILAAVLGLLALLVAFTFGLALDRHEARRSLVVAEANALGTAYLRTSLLDEPARLRALLRDYAGRRLAYGLASGEAQAAAGQRADAVQAQVWAEAIAALTPLRTTPIPGLVLSPINEAFDVATERKAALAARLPTTVLTTLGLYAIVSAAMLGYAVAGAGGRHRIASLAMFALLTLAITLILDLDRPRGGAIRVPQTAMADELAAMRP